MTSPEHKALILTAGDRQARALREELNLRERGAGRTVWQTPDVRSLRQWIADVWADSWPSSQLLGDTQMQALWLDAVERDRRGVISATACAREAHAAEQLAQQYAIDLEDDPAYSEEQRAWRGWRRTVATRMRERDWISAEHLPAIVAAALNEGRIVAPTRVQLNGFDGTLAPALRAVITALRRVCTVEDYPTASEAPALIHAYRCADGEAQMRFIAEEVRRRLAHHADDEVPPRILIALPDPDARRAQLEGALIEHVAPGLRRAAADEDGKARAPWRWDSAAALDAAPLAAGLVAVIALDALDNQSEAASRLLLGAWVGAPALHAQAAAADLALREAGILKISARRLAESAESPLREILIMLATTIESAPRRALPSAWTAHFSTRLEAIGWPGTQTLSSSAFQQVQELRRALTALASLDAQTGAVDAARARLWLRETLKRRFEPRAEHTQPVRIVDAADAQAIDCDLLIVADAVAGAFPGPARGTPFLPIERQRAAGVPQASPAAWLAHRRIKIEALIASAREVILIAPKIDERGGELTASPLFDTGWVELPALGVFSVAERLAANGPHTHFPSADPVPPVSFAEVIRGSAGLFERFAAAPFFAFCADRLGIKALPEVPRGLSPSIQGQLVHATLAAFWNGLADSDALRALTPAERAARIREVLSPLLRRQLPPADFGRALVQLEAARLVDVIGAWLAHEVERPDAFRILAHELKLQGRIGDLPLSLRIDRVEQSSSDPAAPLTLVDYKTGAHVDPNGWREEALTAPQLPLYALLLPDEWGRIEDIAFAHVADGAPEFLRWQTWAATKGRRSPVQHSGDFSAQRAAWRSTLEQIARDFLAGRADIDRDLAAKQRNQPLLALAGLLSDDEIAAADGGGEE